MLIATGGFALLAAGAAIYSAWVFSAQLDTMREDQRAWVSPIYAHHDEGLSVGQTFHVAIAYQNPGKEPALDMADNFEGNIVPTIKAGEGWDTLVIPPNQTCAGVVPIRGHWVGNVPVDVENVR